MPFIGQQPTTGAFLELDSLTASATANYTLQLNGANYYPESVNNLLVSINGVIQGSNTMSLSGSTLTVGATLSSSDTIDFVRVFGNVGTISTPTDGSVTANKIASGAVTSAKLDTNIAVSGNLDVTGQISEAGKEYFHVDLTTAQTGIADNTSVTVDFGGSGTVKYDTKSNFDSANDAYLLDSSDGVYLVSYSICITSDVVTTETLINPTALVRVSTDNGSTFVGVHGSANHVQDSAGGQLGSITVSGTFIYKSTNATTKIQLRAYSNQTGGTTYEIQNNLAGGVNTESGTTLGTDGTSARPTFLTIVRVA